MPGIDNKTNSTMCYCPECGAATRMSYHLPEDCKTIQKLKQQLERSRGETDRLEGKYDVVQQQLAEAKGALIAHDRMQNEQLAKHRDIEILALPDHIVASSDIVDDLCDHFYGLLCKQQQQLAESRGRAERAEQLVFGEFVGYQAYIAECNFILDEDNEEPILNDPVCEQTAGECIKKFFAAIEATKQNEENNNGNG